MPARYAATMMRDVFDAFVRALGNVFLPRVIVLTLVPLLGITALSLLLGYVWWADAVAWMHTALAGWAVLDWLQRWLSVQQPGGLAALLAPLFVLMLAMPLIVVLTLAVVSTVLTPMLTRLVAARRFPQLARLGSGALLPSLAWAAGSLLAAIAALLITLPLWLIPPLVLLLPPLIWGWLTYRLMGFDALSEHATPAERRALLKARRWPLLLIGVLCGYMGAAPGVVWASGALFAAFFLLLVPLAIWIYTFVLALSSLWFAHYCLAALQQLRATAPAATPAPAPATASLPPAPGAGDPATITDVPWRDTPQ